MLGKLGTSACAFPLDVFSITWQPTQSLPAISLPIVTSGIVDSAWLGSTPSSGSWAVEIDDVVTRTTPMHKNPPILLRTDERKRSQASELQIVVTSFSLKLGKMSLCDHSLKQAYSRRVPGQQSTN